MEDFSYVLWDDSGGHWEDRPGGLGWNREHVRQSGEEVERAFVKGM